MDPFADAGHDELDRQQRTVNARPDLETVEKQLAELDATVRATVTKYSPQTVFTREAEAY